MDLTDDFEVGHFDRQKTNEFIVGSPRKGFSPRRRDTLIDSPTSERHGSRIARIPIGVSPRHVVRERTVDAEADLAEPRAQPHLSPATRRGFRPQGDEEV